MKKLRILCDYCGNQAALVKGDVVYPQYIKMHNRFYWHCSLCKAWVGTHKTSAQHEPYGRLAKSHLRYLKAKAHEVFDPLWQSRLPKKGSFTSKKLRKLKHYNRQALSIRAELRRAAYLWLSKKLDVPHRKCHIGMFDEELCQQAIKVCIKERDKEYQEEFNAKGI